MSCTLLRPFRTAVAATQRSPVVSSPSSLSVAARAPVLGSRSVASRTGPHAAFPFLPVNALEQKPRKVGLTEIRAAYYAPFGPRYFQDILETFGEYVDGIKYAGGSFTLHEKESLKKMINLAHDNGVYVSTGGFIERVLSCSAGDFELVNKYLKTCKELGFDVLEISSGFLSIPTEDWANLVELAASHGLKPKPEIGIQFGAGGDTATAELESMGTRDPAWLVTRANVLLDAGADRIMIESEGITENVKTWRTDVISKITESLPMDKVMFEAADPAVFQYYIQNFGVNVNLSIDHSQIVQLACLRRGIWGTQQTFGGRIVSFPFSPSSPPS